MASPGRAQAGAGGQGSVPAPAGRVTGYGVTILPDGHPEAYHFTIAVTYHGRGRWYVEHCGMFLDRAGKWVPAADASCAFSEEKALELAREHAPAVELGGETAADVLLRSRR